MGREIKAKYKALTHHQQDIKHLYDIPRYWPQMKRLGLPKYQYTIRDTKSGLMALGYGSECSEIYAELFTQTYIHHLNRYGIKPKELKLQSDNGSEFGGTRRKAVDYGYVHMIEQRYGTRHGYIPPGMKNANADVESAQSTSQKAQRPHGRSSAKIDPTLPLKSYCFRWLTSMPYLGLNSLCPQGVSLYLPLPILGRIPLDIIDVIKLK